ncbi:hypothetical protein C922_04656 [Plasmodium inui San Antonio 1]|uniref:Uncharacterized protein n=1 Tax=Plasmodium inui San Antonio 1 TaxID=1237626 RepID=W7A729_9APIC|nr:hypothetical protein C922_04656 [Plasmodium inui San Antonio 1]EUD64924.1 hypothetical protein C922_04656 [Plasmodium inui San Antonio 1]
MTTKWKSYNQKKRLNPPGSTSIGLTKRITLESEEIRKGNQMKSKYRTPNSKEFSQAPTGTSQDYEGVIREDQFRGIQAERIRILTEVGRDIQSENTEQKYNIFEIKTTIENNFRTPSSPHKITRNSPLHITQGIENNRIPTSKRKKKLHQRKKYEKKRSSNPRKNRSNGICRDKTWYSKSGMEEQVGTTLQEQEDQIRKQNKKRTITTNPYKSGTNTKEGNNQQRKANLLCEQMNNKQKREFSQSNQQRINSNLLEKDFSHEKRKHETPQ